MNLSTNLAEIKGVGAKTAADFARANLETVRDLLEFFPRRYDDFSKAEKIADLKPGKVVIRAKVESVSTRFVRRGMRITTAVLTDESGKVSAVWFNQSYREKNFKSFANSAQEFLFSGEFKLSANRYQISNPAVEKIDEKPNFFQKDLTDKMDKIIPIYSAKKGLKPATIRKILRELKPLILMLPEILPPEIILRENLISRSSAVSEIHFPTDEKKLAKARERLSFDELFGLILAAKIGKNENQKLAGFTIPFNQPKIANFVANLPFQLTAAQKIALWEILQDFDGGEK